MFVLLNSRVSEQEHPSIGCLARCPVTKRPFSAEVLTFEQVSLPFGSGGEGRRECWGRYMYARFEMTLFLGFAR